MDDWYIGLMGMVRASHRRFESLKKFVGIVIDVNEPHHDGYLLVPNTQRCSNVQKVFGRA